VFLMTLVRIADYLQIQAKRAPTEVLEVRKLISPISQGEWKVHASVRNITTAVDDPEAIYIDGHPGEIQQFLRLRDWLDGIQGELDGSWAVLGEVYGRFSQENFNRFGINLRRIQSNIDKVDEFSRAVRYVPAKVAFEAADVDLLKLLVGPLYSDEPGIGLRELLQNAVDAVRELEDLQKRREELLSVERRHQDADVVVTLECDEAWAPTALTVADRGLGMNLEIVRDYFLKAGASFRRSDAWRQRFEDATGHSSVLRSGRFGIGALAAFLVGDRIKVETRHVESPSDRGLRFSASLEDTSLSLEWTSCPVGTQIRVLIPPERRSLVERSFQPRKFGDQRTRKVEFNDQFGQYFGSHPIVRRAIKVGAADPRTVEIAEAVPGDEDAGALPWRRFDTDDPFTIFWTYQGRYPPYPSVMCNGIIITERNYEKPTKILEYGDLDSPSILVYDKDGRLPINLQRTHLIVPNDDFTKSLSISITDDLMAYALVSGIESHCIGKTELGWLKGQYPGFSSPRYYSYPRVQKYRWFLNCDGFGFSDTDLMCANRPKAFIFAYTNRESDGEAEEIINIKSIPEGCNLLFCRSFSNSDLNRKKSLVRDLVNIENNYLSLTPLPRDEVKILSRRLFYKKSIFNEMKMSRSGEHLLGLIKSIETNTEIYHENWFVISFGECPSSPNVDLREADGWLHAAGVDAIAECYVEQLPDLSSPVARRWLDVLGGSVIPYDRTLRMALFGSGRGQLANYVSLWEQQRNAKPSQPAADRDDLDFRYSDATPE
jgi:molecular chaperone HtpG